MPNRRGFLYGFAAVLSAPLAAGGQPARKVFRIGFLGNSTATLEANLVQPFREGLHDFGYVDGRNAVLEYRWAGGAYERFPAPVAELIALKVDVIVTAGTPAALAVRKTAPAIPLVMARRAHHVGGSALPASQDAYCGLRHATTPPRSVRVHRIGGGRGLDVLRAELP
jgi:putative tryptophan/tyrosine transport system substrate-binding protein